MSAALPPFSARNRRNVVLVDDDFPASARAGLLHVLDEAISKDYVSTWSVVGHELQRIARLPRTELGEVGATAILDSLDWDRVFDFCERLFSHLAQAGQGLVNGSLIRHDRVRAQEFIAEELQRLFQEENLAYEFSDGAVRRRGRRHTADRVVSAEGVLVSAGLESARQHFAKAQRYFRDRTNPDLENAVKEAVCAVEDAAKKLFPDANGATLGDVVKWLTGPEPGKLPKAIAQTLTGAYAFRSGGDGVGHGGSTGGAVTTDIAEYILAMAASQIILLADLAARQPREDEPPF
jgi:AbiJ N-terminal domain 4